MWYKMVITRQSGQADFDIPSTERAYFANVSKLYHGHGLLFGKHTCEDRTVMATFERCDDLNDVKDVFRGWGDIKIDALTDE